MPGGIAASEPGLIERMLAAARPSVSARQYPPPRGGEPGVKARRCPTESGRQDMTETADFGKGTVKLSALTLAEETSLRLFHAGISPDDPALVTIRAWNSAVYKAKGLQNPHRKEVLRGAVAVGSP
jgi:hypothetical protein